MPDPLNEARARFAVWDRHPGTGRRRKRKPRDELELSAPMPNWLPDPLVWFGDVAELDIRGAGARARTYRYEFGDKARLVLDYETGTLMVLGYAPPRAVSSRLSVDDLRAGDIPSIWGALPRAFVVPDYIPGDAPVVGRATAIKYLSDKYGESQQEPYRHRFAGKSRPFVVVDSGGVVALVGYGHYDVSNRGVVDGHGRHADDVSLVEADWPA